MDVITSSEAGEQMAVVQGTLSRMAAANPHLSSAFMQMQQLLTGMLYGLERAEEVCHAQALRIGQLEQELERLQGHEVH